MTGARPSVDEPGLSRRAAVAGLLAALPAGKAYAQNEQSEAYATAVQRAFSEGRYLAAFNQLSPLPSSNVRLAEWAAFVGDEARALASARRSMPATSAVNDATSLDAVSTIAEMARGRRVVILNEAHVAARHRHFLALLVRRLRREGFDHLAAETFSSEPSNPSEDVSLLSSGSQFGFRHGFYTLDPVFAEAVREALGLGYRLVAYEQRSDQRTDATGVAATAQREQAQAENLLTAISRSPQSKFVVHVGYSHIRERPDQRGVSWFAARLSTLSGIDPLTVSQAYTGSFGPHAEDSDLARAVLERFSPRASIVVRDREGTFLGAEAASADLAVFHPSLPDVEGRPGWLAADKRRRRVRIRLPDPPSTGLRLGQAIHASDVDPAIPADQHLLAERATELVFFLRPGRYRIRVESLGGVAHIRTISV